MVPVLIIGLISCTRSSSSVGSSSRAIIGSTENQDKKNIPNDESDFQVTLTTDNMGVVISKYTGKKAEVVIPEIIQNMPVREIGDNAFYDPYLTGVYNYVTMVVIPEGVTRIGSSAFRECNHLNSIILPSTLKVIEFGVFYDCSMLSSIDLPSGLLEIGDCTFWQCKALLSINLPSTIKKIGSDAFRSSGLASFPNPWPIELTSIANGMFENALFNDLILPDGITSVGSGAFSFCRNLTNVTLPFTIQTLDTNAFRGCRSLTNVNIPESVQSIGFDFWVFESCSNIDLKSQARLKQLGYTGNF